MRNRVQPQQTKNEHKLIITIHREREGNHRLQVQHRPFNETNKKGMKCGEENEKGNTNLGFE